MSAGHAATPLAPPIRKPSETVKYAMTSSLILYEVLNLDNVPESSADSVSKSKTIESAPRPSKTV